MRRVVPLLLAGAGLVAGLAATAHGEEPVHIVTYLDEQPPAHRRAAQALQRYVQASRREDGNVRSDAWQEVGRPGRFVLQETWRDAPAFAAHGRAPAAVALTGLLATFERSPPDQRILHGFDREAAAIPPGSRALYLVSHLDVIGPRREEAEHILRGISADSRGRPGHVRFDVYQQNEPRLNHFTLVTVWTSRAAFEAYGASAVWRRFMRDITPLLGAPYDERLYQRLD